MTEHGVQEKWTKKRRGDVGRGGRTRKETREAQDFGRRRPESGKGGRQGHRARSKYTYQGFPQPLLVAAVELLSLPGSIDRLVQGLTKIHEARLILSQLLLNTCGQ